MLKEKEMMNEKLKEKKKTILEQQDKMLFELTSLAKEIKEANQICEMIGKRIQFRQCKIQLLDNDDVSIPQIGDELVRTES